MVKNLIRLFFQKQADLGLCCLVKPICPNTVESLSNAMFDMFGVNRNRLCYK